MIVAAMRSPVYLLLRYVEVPIHARDNVTSCSILFLFNRERNFRPKDPHKL